MKSVCVVAVYTVCILMLLSCWPGMYWIWAYVERPLSAVSEWVGLSTDLDPEVTGSKFLRNVARKAHVNTAEATETNSTTTKKCNKVQALQFIFQVNCIFKKSPVNKIVNNAPSFLIFYYFLFFRRCYIFPPVCRISNLTQLFQHDQIQF